MSITTYDKAKWHFPDGTCPTLEQALLHLKGVVTWLEAHSLLSPFGKQLARFTIGSDFALTSEMLTNEGNEILSAEYDNWLRSLRYGERLDTELLDEALSKLREKKS